jgi:hypothetical protein
MIRQVYSTRRNKTIHRPCREFAPQVQKKYKKGEKTLAIHILDKVCHKTLISGLNCETKYPITKQGFTVGFHF